MKVDQKAVLRWVSKQVAKRSERAARRVGTVQELSGEQLRHVSGGDGGSSLPNKGW